MLVIVPSEEQFSSYLEEIETDMADIGCPISGALKATSGLGLKQHRLNQAEVFVTTIQTLAVNRGDVDDLLSTGLWLLAADEFHRYSKNNTWGEALTGLNVVFRLAVSATPDRTDRANKAIDGVADVRVTLKEAVEEGAIRPVIVRSSDYAIDITLKDEDTPRRLSTAELRQELADTGADISASEVKRELRYFSKYLYKAILDAYIKLIELNTAQQGQHKMIVFAMGVGHAKTVCDQINGIAGEKVADWIGVQSSVPKDDGTIVTIGRSDKDNKTVLENFKAGKFNVLVQVKKATEGFNDVRCSVLLF
jgi:superfamily II DNA or RNA helicase